MSATRSGPEDPRIDAIVLVVGRRGDRITPNQFDALALLAYLSHTLRLCEVGDCHVEGARRITVEVDGYRYVEIDWDGRLELLEVVK